MTIPLPPAAAELAEFPTTVLDEGYQLIRIHAAGMAPTFYGGYVRFGRFNPPPRVTSFGTCYAAKTFHGAVVEKLCRDGNPIQTSELSRFDVSVLTSPRGLSLANFTHPRALRFGLTGEASAGGDPLTYDRCQLWAAALLESGFGGIAYHARNDPSLESISFAVFGAPGVSDTPLAVKETSELDVDLTAEALAYFGFEVLPPELL